MSEFTYPDRLEIRPYPGRGLAAAAAVPGSKSITNRALVLAALHAQATDCGLTGVLHSEDTEVMVESLRRLGFLIDVSGTAIHLRATSSHGVIYPEDMIPARSADLFVGNSGTTVRFLAAMCGLGRGRYRLDGVPRMRERPIQDLLDGLNQFGATARSEFGTGCPPVVVEAKGLRGGTIKVKGNVSSQFLSALLMVAPFASGGVTVEIDGPLVSVPYVEMTVQMMRQWHVEVIHDWGRMFRVSPNRAGGVSEYAIEPDASAASYFWAAAAILGGHVTVPGLNTRSLQGDVAFVDVLEQMGCTVVRAESGITVHGGPLRGADVDMNAISDTVMTLGAVACFADGPTRIRNVGHIRHKETDRIAALAAELRRVGAEVIEESDGLTITPRPLHGATIQTYNDHRMAMSLALVGLKVPGVVIENPGCVAKTYPGFWQDLARLQNV